MLFIRREFPILSAGALRGIETVSLLIGSSALGDAARTMVDTTNHNLEHDSDACYSS